ncbi:MAG: PGPGW domain-containing protein [Phycisphaerales bacterium]|nr:PGPGW domain-containing protein [Planctomycetota bacterium]
MTLEIFDFWLELTLLAALACLLVYGIFDTRFELARRKGADAIALLRRNTRRLWVLIVGTAVIALGIVISPLPGPGFSVLGPLGLAILATEFVWARKLAVQIKERSGPLREATRRVAESTPRIVVLPVCAAYWAAATALAIWSPIPSVVLWPAASILFTPVFLWAYLTIRGPRPD